MGRWNFSIKFLIPSLRARCFSFTVFQDDTMPNTLPTCHRFHKRMRGGGHFTVYTQVIPATTRPCNQVLVHSLKATTGILLHSPPQSTMVHHGPPQSTMVHHSPPQSESTTVHRSPPRSTTVHHSPPRPPHTHTRPAHTAHTHGPHTLTRIATNTFPDS